MKALILLSTIVSAIASTHLPQLPYVYLLDQIPVYHQSHNTKTGEHAFSYAGGPSAKEEVRSLDGVTRGSYSYIDPHGILQSVFYVADDGGFRVAATNLPTDGDLSAEAHELAEKNLEEHAKTSSSRRKRGIENSQQDTDQEKKRKGELKAAESDQDQIPSALTSLVLQSLAIPELVTATSRQHRIQIHNDARIETAGIEETPLSSKKAIVQSIPDASVANAEDHVSSVLLLPYEDRIQFHRRIGLEGPGRTDAIRIKAEPVAVLPSVPTIPAVVTKETVSIVQPIVSIASPITAFSSQRRSQIHRNSKVEITGPAVKESNLHIETVPRGSVQQAINLPIFDSIPLAQSSQFHSRVDSNRKIEVLGKATF